jgi:hypothetical protein
LDAQNVGVVFWIMFGWGSPNLLDTCCAHLQSVFLVTTSAHQFPLVLLEAFTCKCFFHMSLFTFLSPDAFLSGYISLNYINISIITIVAI